MRYVLSIIVHQLNFIWEKIRQSLRPHYKRICIFHQLWCFSVRSINMKYCVLVCDIKQSLQRPKRTPGFRIPRTVLGKTTDFGGSTQQRSLGFGQADLMRFVVSKSAPAAVVTANAAVTVFILKTDWKWLAVAESMSFPPITDIIQWNFNHNVNQSSPGKCILNPFLQNYQFCSGPGMLTFININLSNNSKQADDLCIGEPQSLLDACTGDSCVIDNYALLFSFKLKTPQNRNRYDAGNKLGLKVVWNLAGNGQIGSGDIRFDLDTVANRLTCVQHIAQP